MNYDKRVDYIKQAIYGLDPIETWDLICDVMKASAETDNTGKLVVYTDVRVSEDLTELSDEEYKKVLFGEQITDLSTDGLAEMFNRNPETKE